MSTRINTLYAEHIIHNAPNFTSDTARYMESYLDCIATIRYASVSPIINKYLLDVALENANYWKDVAMASANN